ncbi:hypothetical protein BDP27DRAFT_435218 [Rhodocollybia butyracea]|nr:hypothetical protein BDP27DRAFT_435218 [Rhodocollybia butyracea]
MIREILGNPEKSPRARIEHNTATLTSFTSKDYPVSNFQYMVVHFVIQGSTPCDKYPCFGCIRSAGRIYGSIFSMSTDGTWERVPTDLAKWGSDDFGREFKKTEDEWMNKWNTVTSLGVMILENSRKGILDVGYALSVLAGQNAAPKTDHHSKSPTPEPPSPQHNPIVPGITLFNRPLNGHADFRKQEVQGDSGLPKISKDPSYDPFMGHDPEDPYSLSLHGHQVRDNR